MTPMLVQSYLRAGNSPESLTTRFGISVKPHPRYPSLLMLKYDQINSPFAEPLVRECRGVILDSADDWRAVSRPFDKFFNHGEALAAPIDWTTARVQEKCDGSLISVYRHFGEWQIASSGTPDASGPVGASAKTFRMLFLETMARHAYELPPARFAHCTFMYELMTKCNRIVVRHEEPRVVLLAVRETESGVEIPVEAFKSDPMPPVVRSFPLQSFADLATTFETMNPLEQEGYVVVDAQSNRVKVKHPGYVALHHMISSTGPKAILEIIRKGETTELLTHFPEWTEEFNVIQSKYDSLLEKVDSDFEAHRSIEAQKDFAIAVNTRTELPAAMFYMRNGAGTSKDFLAAWHIKHLMDKLGLCEAAPSVESA